MTDLPDDAKALWLDYADAAIAEINRLTV